MNRKKRHSPREIRNAALAAGRMLGGAYVDHRPLSVVRRRALGGLYFPEAPGIVYLVAGVLTGHSGLFRRARVPGPELKLMQETADSWNMLRLVLFYLLIFASDRYLECQGEAIEAALDVVRRFKAETQMPDADEDEELRQRGAALRMVLHKLEQRRLRSTPLRPRKVRPRSRPMDDIDFDEVFEALLEELQKQDDPPRP